MHEVLLGRAAERDLKRLSHEMFQRMIQHINALAETPRPTGCHKIAGSHNDWRIRVGDYRLIYEIDDKEKIIRVMRIRHRREVYR